VAVVRGSAIGDDGRYFHPSTRPLPARVADGLGAQKAAHTADTFD